MPRGGRTLPAAASSACARADAILHAGDLMEASVLEDLQALGPPVHAVRGTSTRPSCRRGCRSCAMVRRRRRRADRHAPRCRAGRRSPARMRRRFPEAHALVFGHSHMPLHEYAPTASPSSTPARRPSAGARRITRWAWPPSSTAGCAFELIELDHRLGYGGPLSAWRASSQRGWTSRSSSRARPSPCRPRAEACRRRSGARSATRCRPTAGRAPSSSSALDRPAGAGRDFPTHDH